MKKVSTIRKAQPAVQETQAPVDVLSTLHDYEMTMLRHLIRTKERVIDQCKAAIKVADSDVSEYIRFILELRKLDPTEYGIAMADFKTIQKLDKPVPTESAPANA